MNERVKVCPRHADFTRHCDYCLMVRKHIKSLKTQENWWRMDEIGSRHQGKPLPPWRIDRFGSPIIPKEHNGKSG